MDKLNSTVGNTHLDFTYHLRNGVETQNAQRQKDYATGLPVLSGIKDIVNSTFIPLTTTCVDNHKQAENKNFTPAEYFDPSKNRVENHNGQQVVVNSRPGERPATQATTSCEIDNTLPGLRAWRERADFLNNVKRQ